MATYGTQKVFGGTQHKRYPDPRIKGTANEFGLYQWSAFRASMGNVNTSNGEMDYANTNALDNPLELLLFVADVPAILTGVGFDATTNLSTLAPFTNKRSSNYILSATSGGSAPVGPANYGTVLFGYAGPTNTVFCSGFSANGEFLPVGGTQGTVTRYTLECLCNSAVINAPIASLKPNSADVFAPNAVLLKSSDYTQAILDAGNVYTSPTNKVSQIVGLYYEIVGQ
jgi:hypothetical protein